MKQRNPFIAIGFGILALGAASAVQAQEKVRIGFITDMSGLYADLEGKNGATAIQMAIDDFGGKVNGLPIELLTADHQNKADIAASKAREWIDTQGLSMVFSGTNSGTALATAKVATEKKRVHFNNGAASSALTNEQCSPYTVHYAYDTVALAKGTGAAVVDRGGKSWFFLTADYAFGAALEADPVLRTQIALFEVRAKAFAAMSERFIDELKAGRAHPAQPSMMKYVGTELNKDRHELMRAAGGSDALEWESERSNTGAAPRAWLRTKANSIEGGTSEIQLNIIAKRILELPGA